ncbi:FAD-dependent monooxygenase [Streptomyces sp. A3M-1-3]|uniref:FAD-dependent oxidoreductase n=1 Tax=Streptomyces sp. A3M-1-3 TaxID=2962044 RepID=UPI0020B8D85A|nr:FAD-dependent monooxygenase [Streptomyces sp. A3M-1-3]MCP3821641.1 FAD-dependent monooxygenase [Streptomyces sp. A3M-1-3]
MNRHTAAGAPPVPDTTDVLIVGAGPTGLMLGCELRARGIECTVVDAAPGIDRRTRAVMVHAASLEALEALGLRRETERRGLRQQRISFHVHHGAVHTVEFAGLDTPYPYYVNVPQPEVEEVLAEALAERGGRLVRGVRYDSHHEDPAVDSLRVELSGPAGELTVRARYLVGADGASSTVRERLGVGFPGVTYPMSYLLAEGEPLRRPDPDASSMYIGPGGAVSLLPLPGGVVRVAGPVSADSLDRGAAVSDAAFRSAVDQLGFGSVLRLRSVGRPAHYQVHERLAERFRSGRVVLAGDAAHLNSPAGGQAMNTGFADAAALAWRLARLVRGQGDDGLLGDYARERRRAAADVARATGVLDLLQAMRDAVSDDSRRAVQESLDGCPEVWSQLYTTYAAPDGGSTAPLPRRETYRLDVGARLPGHLPAPDRFTLLHHPGIPPRSRQRPPHLPDGTLHGVLTTRQAAWLPAGAAALLIRPDRHVAAVVPAQEQPAQGPEVQPAAHRIREVLA